MREILFKAKQVGDDEWVEGYYQKRYNFLGNEEHLIFHVDSHTVWECTEITIKDFTQHFQKILIIDMSLVFGVKKLMSEETFSTIKNYYRRINNGESNNYN